MGLDRLVQLRINFQLASDPIPYEIDIKNKCDFLGYVKFSLLSKITVNK